MTPISFNEVLRDFTDVIGKERVRKVFTAPFLTLRTLNEPITKADSEAIRLLDERDGLCRSPFHVARYCFKIGADEMFGFIERQKSQITFFVLHREGPKFNKICWLVEFLEGTHPFNNAIKCRTRVLNSKTGKDETLSYERVWVDYRQKKAKNELAKLEAITTKAKALEELANFSRAELIEKRDQLTTEIQQGLKAVKELTQGIDVLRGSADFMTRVIGPNLGVCGQIFEPTTMEDDVKGFMDKALYCLLMIGCYEYLAPYNFMALVQPNKEGKSVEWTKAREHYTIIHRHHPANNEAVGEGDSITESESKILERTAHSRRAHTRLLSSPKFRFKQGLRVFVRACWVGPKEWKDEGGKQIYKILVERNGLEIAA